VLATGACTSHSIGTRRTLGRVLGPVTLELVNRQGSRDLHQGRRQDLCGRILDDNDYVSVKEQVPLVIRSFWRTGWMAEGYSVGQSTGIGDRL